ncbi:MAG: response regulator [Parasulfuritortus sp.]|nr:response regulator [Parasulfuritortus sp.]
MLDIGRKARTRQQSFDEGQAAPVDGTHPGVNSNLRLTEGDRTMPPEERDRMLLAKTRHVRGGSTGVDAGANLNTTAVRLPGFPPQSPAVPETELRAGKVRGAIDGDQRNDSFPEVTKGLVKIEVMDTGIGVSKQGIAKLFQRYQQADATISRNYGGTGLGLWISRSIIQKMGGDIKIKSRLGQGTNMIVVFRSEVCPEVSVLTNIDHKSISLFKQDIKGKNCLVVDDIPDNTYIMQQLLSQNGLNVVAMNRAQDALEAYKKTRDIDLVITDLRMPGMSGQALIMEIRKVEAETGRNRTPIMVLTGEAARDERIACLSQYGADDYLLKPIKLQDLMASVEGLLIKRPKAKTAKRILVIDDDLMSRKLIITLIKQSGDDAFGCASIAEAKCEIDKNYDKYQGILLDSQLPDGIGLDFMVHYAELLKNKGTKQLPVISMSGNSAQDQEKLYLGYPLHAFLEKPVSKSQLLDVLRSIQ